MLEEIQTLKTEKLVKGLEIKTACGLFVDRMELFMTVTADDSSSRLQILENKVNILDKFEAELRETLVVLFAEYSDCKKFLEDARVEILNLKGFGE